LTIQDNFQCCALLIKYQDSQLEDYQGSQEPARRLPKLIEGPASRALLIKYQDSQLGDYQGSQEPAWRLPTYRRPLRALLISPYHVSIILTNLIHTYHTYQFKIP